MILSKNYDEVFFVRDEEMFALILDYESAMFTLDTIKENTTGTSEYVNDMSKGTLHFAQPLFKLDVGGNSEEEEEFAKNLQKRNMIKMMKDLIYIKYDTAVPVSTHKDFLSALLKCNSNVSDNKKKNKDNKLKTLTLDDVILPEKTKKELRKIVDMMKNNDRLIRIGARPIKGIVLYGESGTGKTLTAKILSNEIDSKFIYKSGSEFKGKYQSEGCEKVKKLFEEARNYPSACIFIDEADSLLAQREEGENKNDSNMTVNQILTELDGFDKNENIFVIIATNRLDMIDEAAKRSGRFDTILHIGIPTFENRVDLFELYINKVEHDKDIDFVKLAELTKEITGADVDNIVNQSAIDAVLIHDRDYVIEQDIIDVINRLGMNKEDNKKANKIGF